MSELPAPSRLQLLRFLEKVQLQDLQRTRGWIATEEQHVAAEAVRRPAPPPPEWLIERGIGVGRLPVRVHAGGCWDARKRCTAMTMEEARRAPAEGVPARPQCRPDAALGME